MSTHNPGYSRIIARLLQEKDLENLLGLLRNPLQAEQREQAALALGDLGDFEATELLVRASREDPDGGVRAAARQALSTLLGAEAQQVIASYPENTAGTPWLKKATEYVPAQHAVDDEVDESEEFASHSDEDSAEEDEDAEENQGIVADLLARKDANGLIALLRNPQQADLRAQAAQSLAELGKMEATELLVRATHEDPEGSVRSAARQALQTMFGIEATQVIASYAGTAAPDPWLVETTVVKTAPVEKGRFDLSEEELGRFIVIARTEGNPRLRLQAIRVLGNCLNPAATDVLARLALWGESTPIRQAARHALQALHGEHFSEIIANYRAAAMAEARDSGMEDQAWENLTLELGEIIPLEDEEGLEDAEEYEEEDEIVEDEDEAESAGQAASPYRSAISEPVTEEIGRPNWLIWVGFALVGLVILFFLISGN